MMNTKNLSLLAFVPIVIYMMVIPMFDLYFTLKMVILSVIISNSLIISIYLNSQKSKEERNRKNLQLMVAMSISLMVFLFQFYIQDNFKLFLNFIFFALKLFIMDYLLPLIIPVIISIVLLTFGFSIIIKQTDIKPSARTFWYIFMAVMPFVALIVFYFVEVKPKAD